jgi:hypothetical protein
VQEGEALQVEHVHLVDKEYARQQFGLALRRDFWNYLLFRGFLDIFFL